MGNAKESGGDVKSLAAAARRDADAADTGNGGKVVAGPWDVGNIGHVAVVERKLGKSDKSYTYAEFSGTGRASRIPLAAVAIVAEKL